MNLVFLLPIIFFISLGGVLYLVLSKIPSLSRIPQESIANQETFLLFLSRTASALRESLDAKKLRIYALTQITITLNYIRVFFLRAYHAVEHLTKKASRELQKTEWEHQWFSKKEVERQNDAVARDNAPEKPAAKEIVEDQGNATDKPE